MKDLIYFSPDVTVFGGGAFLHNFQESLFLAWNYTLGTNFVPNVLKKFCQLLG